jgi:hypothetical protein
MLQKSVASAWYCQNSAGLRISIGVIGPEAHRTMFIKLSYHRLPAYCETRIEDRNHHHLFRDLRDKGCATRSA